MAVELFSGPKVAGCGVAVPDSVLTNPELVRKYGIDSSDEWIQDNVGIRERRILSPDHSVGHKRKATSDMAIAAAKAALEDADIKPKKLDGIILVTVSGDYPGIPDTASIVQEALGVEGFAFDIGAGCAGSIHGLLVAKAMIETGEYKTIAVIAADTLSRFTNRHDRGTSILFGDGAAALILQQSNGPVMRMTGEMITKGDPSILCIPAGGSLEPSSMETVLNNEHFIHMDGRAVARMAVREMSESMHVTMKKAGVALERVKFIVPHQANLNIIKNLIKREKLDPEQVIVKLQAIGTPLEFLAPENPENAEKKKRPQVLVNIDRYGNTSAASILIALAEADARGKQLTEFEKRRKYHPELQGKIPDDRGALRSNDDLMLVAFGAGPKRASMYLKWKENLDEVTPYKVIGRFKRFFSIPFAFLNKN